MSLLKKYSCMTVSVFLVAAVTLIWSVAALAQLTTGKVEGYVRNKDTGAPLAGAQVSIAETRLGNVTNQDGYYFILNVPPGLRTITAVFTGYQKTSVTDQRILSGQTVTVNFMLSSTVIQLEGIRVEGNADVLVPRDQTVTKQRLMSEDIDRIATEGLKDVLELQAGVATGGEGGLKSEMRIRGGRPGEEAFIIDGIMVRNLTAEPLAPGGPAWWGDIQENQNVTTSIPLELSTTAVEQVDVITGGWQAEYGNVQSGVINIVTKSGGDFYKGSLRFTTDELNPETASWGYDRLQANVGGPVPAVPYLTFNLTSELQGRKDMNPSHADEGYRGITQNFVDNLNKSVKSMSTELGPNPYSLEKFETAYNKYVEREKTDPTLRSVEFANPSSAILPDNWGDKTLLSGKVQWSPLSSLMLFSTANFSRNQRIYYEHGKLYNKGRIYQYGTENTALGDEVRYILPNFGERNKTHTVMAGFDWDFLKSAERNALLQGRFNHMYNTQVIHSTPQRGWDRKEYLGWSPGDMKFEVEWYPNREIRMSDPAQVEHLPDKTAVEEWNLPAITPFGMPSALGFSGDGYILRYEFLQENQNAYKFDFDYQWSRQNRMKVGLDATQAKDFTFAYYSYNRVRSPETDFSYRPLMMGTYIQNRLDVGDFVMNMGLRYDRFDPKSNWGIRNFDLFGYYYFPKKFSSVSPRFDVGFPVTDRSQMRLAYGRFSQLPSLQYIFGSSNYGGLGYQVTESFEAGYTHILGNDWVADLVTYYKDIDGNVATRQYWRDYTYVDNTSGELRLNRGYTSGLTNKDNGNIKGVDFTLRKSFSKYYSLNTTYTLEFSRTTGSRPSDNSGVYGNYDPTTLQSGLPPDELTVINQDRTHKLNIVSTLAFPRDIGGEGSMANRILRDFSATATFRLLSGTPYTRSGTTANGLSLTIGGYNFFRDRSFYNLDLRLNKYFDLGPARVAVFSEIFNVLNRKEPVQWAVNYTYDNIADYYRYTYLNGARYENMTTLVDKLYFLSDYNADGVLSLDELIMGRTANALAVSSDADPRNWGQPRQVRLGFEVNF